MACYVPRQVLSLALCSLLMVFPVALSSAEAPATLTYHGGELLKRRLNVGIMWYGKIPRVQKRAILSFFRSLNAPTEGDGPLVSKWWNIVASYHEGGVSSVPARLPVKVVNQVADPEISEGPILITDFIKPLVPRANGGKPNTVAVIICVKGITVQDMCAGSCAQHGLIENNQTYVAVGNPEEECPACAWPFVMSHGKIGKVLKPPSGNVGADVMVGLLAAGLAGVVTNPYGDGFFATSRDHQFEAANNCPNIFAKTKLAVDPVTGASYNAVGDKGAKFLLPAVWDPKTSSCWTPL